MKSQLWHHDESPRQQKGRPVAVQGHRGSDAGKHEGGAAGSGSANAWGGQGWEGQGWRAPKAAGGRRLLSTAATACAAQPLSPSSAPIHNPGKLHWQTFIVITLPAPCLLQESREAAQRADMHNPDKLAAAGRTNTGQTLQEQVEAQKEGADPQVGGFVHLRLFG